VYSSLRAFGINDDVADRPLLKLSGSATDYTTAPQAQTYIHGAYALHVNEITFLYLISELFWPVYVTKNLSQCRKFLAAPLVLRYILFYLPILAVIGRLTHFARKTV